MVVVPACSETANKPAGTNPTGPTCVGCDSTPSGSSSGIEPPAPVPGVKDGAETDVDCGGPIAPKCAEGKTCASDTDCESSVCSYAKRCILEPSCRPHLGGDTCGLGEVDDPEAT